MRSVEVSAATREAAITMALDKLGAERHEVDVEILDEGSRGLFGIGKRPVRLRVTDETARHEPEAQKPPRKRREAPDEDKAQADGDSAGDSSGDREKRPRGRRGGRRGRGAGRAGGESQEATSARGGDDPKDANDPKDAKQSRGERGGRPERGERGGRGGRGRGSRRDETAEPRQESVAPAADSNQPANAEGESGGRPRRRRRRGGATRREGVRRETRNRNEDRGSDEGQPRAEAPARQSQRDDAPPRSARADSGRDAERAPRPAPQPTEPISEERAHEASALLTEIVGMMGMEAQVSHELQDDGGCTLRVATEDSALLIGRKAQTLLALQYLVNRVIRQHEEENLQLIMVDIEGYIERRREELTELALRMAEQAKEERRRVRLKPLTPQERRIVHVALQEDEDLRTFSVGDGAMRSVVIAPKDEESPPPRGGRGGRGGRRENGEGRQRRVEGRFSDDESTPAERGSDAPDEPNHNAEVAANHDGGADGPTDDETRRPGDE